MIFKNQINQYYCNYRIQKIDPFHELLSEDCDSCLFAICSILFSITIVIDYQHVIGHNTDCKTCEHCFPVDKSCLDEKRENHWCDAVKQHHSHVAQSMT